MGAVIDLIAFDSHLEKLQKDNMNFVTGFLLGLAICNGVMARNVNGGYGGSFKCGDEHEICESKGTVRYGKGSTWTEMDYVDEENAIACTNGVFGDPLHGTVKECVCLLSGNLGL